MRMCKVPIILMLVAFSVTLFAGDLSAQEPKRSPRIEYPYSPAPGAGERPMPVDRSYRAPAHQILRSPMQPPTWDWRGLGGLTPVKNQNPFGTCWAFGTLADLESQILIHEGITTDYSENNIVHCAPNLWYDEPGGRWCDTGGHSLQAINYLSQFGSAQEICDSYPGACNSIVCNNFACPFLHQVTEYQLITFNYTDVNAIKHAVMNLGPATTSMFSTMPNTYDGSYCFDYIPAPGSNTNHCVMIVGWDDAMCGGNGGWIVKNSWGAGWGDNGYFYMEYDAGNIGFWTGVVTGYKEVDPDETIYNYDEYGWMGVGFGYDDDGDDWGMIEITPTADGSLHAVDFYLVDHQMTYNVYVYDTFSGGTLSNLLAGPISGGETYAGFYSVSLPSPVAVTTGDPIYIAISFETTIFYGFPVPADVDGPMETNRNFLSNDGTAWDAIDAGDYGLGDLAIRARIIEEDEECEELGLSLLGYRTVDWTPPLWTVQVALLNEGPGHADNIVATMNSDIPWLIIPDPTCDYGFLCPGEEWWGNDQYVFDLTGHPGGSFNVWFDVTYTDDCGDGHRVRLDPGFNPETNTDTPDITTYRLSQNYPNPFNPNTSISFQIAEAGHVDLRIYDASGKLVRTLVDEHRNVGLHAAHWDGKDRSGVSVASGIYFYKMISGPFSETKKMILMR